MSDSSHFTLGHGDLTNDGNERRLVDAGGEPTNHVGKGLEVILVTDQFHRIKESGSDSDIRKSDLITHQVSLGQEVVVQCSKSLGKVFLGLGIAVWMNMKIITG